MRCGLVIGCLVDWVVVVLLSAMLTAWRGEKWPFIACDSCMLVIVGAIKLI